MYSPNEKQKVAIEAVLKGENVFITGGAGVGKTATIEMIQEKFNKPYAIVAPTGIAAANAGGVTVHKFFSLMPSDTDSDNKDYIHKVVYRVLRRNKIPLNIKAIVFDEVSMISGRLLNLVDLILRKKFVSSEPFGGIQIIFIGCFYQLHPVTHRDVDFIDFAFNAPCWKALNPKVIKLNTIVRQTDTRMQECLGDLRIGIQSERLTSFMDELQKKEIDIENDPRPPVLLFSTNREKDNENTRRLDAIPGKSHSIKAIDEGEQTYLKELLLPQTLIIKVGARVMALTNDSDNRFYNGSLGIVSSISPARITVTFDNGLSIQLERVVSDVRLVSSCKTESVVVASRMQFPLTLAWATTIHKAQGLTLDKVVVNLHRVFSPGQVYVALSRAKSPDGLWIRNWKGKGIEINVEVDKFYSSVNTEVPIERR
jgi:ATP-dependent exoDNAse (exonuclease V) alpha subunit